MTHPPEPPERPADADVLAGQAVYSRSTLAAYDVLVLGLSCRLIWRCPKARMLDAYHRNVRPRHLDCGVGTGYFLDRVRPAQPFSALTLLDLNANALQVTASRVARYAPQQVRADVFEPLPVPAGGFDSVGLNFLLHCLPGGWDRKGVVLEHAGRALSPGGRIFGSTILSAGVPVSAPARRLMAVYNARGIFHNTEDDLDGLRALLTSRFDDVRLTTHGSVALFEATARG